MNLKLREFKDRLDYIARPCQKREKGERKMRRERKVGGRKEQ